MHPEPAHNPGVVALGPAIGVAGEAAIREWIEVAGCGRLEYDGMATALRVRSAREAGDTFAVIGGVLYSGNSRYCYPTTTP